MNRTSRVARAAAAAATIALAIGAAACSSSSKKGEPVTANHARMTGSLTVFAAASLTAAFTNAKAALTAANPGLTLTYNFAGSNTLVSQIRQGAPADVFASADTKNMQSLVDAGLVDAPVTFAKNKLEIAVARGNPKHITSLADLASPGVAVVLGASGVPAGDYASSVLAAKHIAVTPKSVETDVKAALAKVTNGEADAAIVYATDVAAAAGKAQGVSIPDADQPDISYPIAVVKATKNRAAAQAFVTAAVSGEVQKALGAAGFFPPL